MITRLNILLFLLCVLALGAGCRTATEQGTVQVEVTAGKIVTVHEPGELFTTFGPNTTAYEVDLRDHLDGIDIEGVTKDNAPFYMKIDVVYRPLHDKVSEYLTAFGFDDTERAARRWNVLNQLVKNAARNATSGKYDAYGLRANQGQVLQDIGAELKDKLASEMFLQLVSVGMEIQPQFKDSKIDDAANAVVAAQKNKEAEQQYLEAAKIKAEKSQVEAQVYATNPAALELQKLQLQLENTRALAQGIAQHQGTLILNGTSAGPQLQLQVPNGGKQ